MSNNGNPSRKSPTATRSVLRAKIWRVTLPKPAPPFSLDAKENVIEPPVRKRNAGKIISVGVELKRLENRRPSTLMHHTHVPGRPVDELGFTVDQFPFHRPKVPAVGSDGAVVAQHEILALGYSHGVE